MNIFIATMASLSNKDLEINLSIYLMTKLIKYTQNEIYNFALFAGF